MRTQAALDALEDEDYDDDGGHKRGGSSGSSDGGGGGGDAKHGWPAALSPGRRRSSSGGGCGGNSSGGGGGPHLHRDKPLHLTVRVRLGGTSEDAPQALKPVPVQADGTADVAQAAVFAVLRPLQEAEIVYELCLGLGPRGPPLVTLTFSYSLLHLLRRSPAQPITWDDWRAVSRATVPGLKVWLAGWRAGRLVCTQHRWPRACMADDSCMHAPAHDTSTSAQHVAWPRVTPPAPHTPRPPPSPTPGRCRCLGCRWHAWTCLRLSRTQTAGQACTRCPPSRPRRWPGRRQTTPPRPRQPRRTRSRRRRWRPRRRRRRTATAR
jgi:hypothetical protein